MSTYGHRTGSTTLWKALQSTNEMAKILAVGNGKGGVGKTTTSVTLAECFSTKKRRVFFVDADPQGSSTRWLDRCDVPFDYSQETDLGLLQSLTKIPGYDLIIADTTPYRDSEKLQVVAHVADFFLMPSSPDWMDIEELIETIKKIPVLSEKQYRVLLTLVDPRSCNRKGIFSKVVKAQSSLNSAGIPCLKSFVRRYEDFPTAHADGKVITQVRTQSARNAISDYRGVARELQRIWRF